MNQICPKCNHIGKHERLVAVKYPMNMATLVTGVMIYVLLYQQGQKANFSCEKCNAIFKSLTAKTITFATLFWLFLLFPVLVVFVVVLTQFGNAR
jgi:hypothetical protein